MRTHPAAELLPLMHEDELRALAEDVRENGLREPIKVVTVEGEQLILDGRNRSLACERAGVEPRFEEVDLGGDDPIAYVVSLNVRRRSLSRDQRAVAAAEAWSLCEVGQGKRADLTSAQSRAEV